MWKLSPKILFMLVSIVMFTNQSIVNGARLKCKYRTEAVWYGFSEALYYCHVQNNGIFTGERVIMDSVEGLHTEGLTNANVQGVWFNAIPNVKFFPQNLEKIFTSLMGICIDSTNLQQVKQQDLEPFPKLKSLELFNNKITTLDAELFKFNPDLEIIVLYNNQISQIDPNVFDHLDNLSWLYLNGNPCKNALSDVENSRSGVIKLIQQVRDGDCVATTFMEKEKQINDLEDKLREAENASQEKIKILEESIAELHKNFTDQRQQLHEKLIKSQYKCVNLLQSKDAKVNELNDKYAHLQEIRFTEMKELSEKYTSLLNAKLIASEKVIKEQNENICKINSVDDDEAGDG